ncbi:uncharacterized protein LOC132200730 [Neocloeon triangulifer]|uniref:uncharacterized protein LOC132200730 n=1 Tax=Neocloeon triangulifer TaxID=2078957 RepID=UPI00286F5F76|nr:uncharacterized protein LOC132200730 [Neocloeon triangulifer]
MYSRGLCALALALLVTQVASSESNRVKRQSSSTCTPELLTRALKCCAVPQLYSSDAATGCPAATRLSTVSSVARQTGRQIAKSFSSKLDGARGFKNATRAIGRGIKDAAGAIRSGFNNATKMVANPLFCRMECIFQNQSLLTSAGELDYDLASKAYVSAAPDQWKAVVQEATANCTGMFKNMDSAMANKTMPQMPEGFCKPCAAGFDSCVQARVAMKCPTAGTNGRCSADLKTLQSCGKNVMDLLGIPKPPPPPQQS